jgi:hypothetical protein
MHSVELSIFQLWYIARWREVWKIGDSKMNKLLEAADDLFPGLEGLSREDQIRRGNELLAAQLLTTPA